MTASKAFTDQVGRKVDVPSPPKRIISLVPSQTEFLSALGLEEEVIGITKFCVHPERWFRSKTRVGGTKQLNLELIHSLQPDLIIANKEENQQTQIESLAAHFPVWISDVKTLNDACLMMRAVGEMTGKEVIAEKLISEIQQGLLHSASGTAKKDCTYLIWNDPVMTVGRDTFIHHMLDLAGFNNVFADRLRYPVVSLAELKERNPSYILLSSEPFPFNSNHVHVWSRQFPQSKVMVVNGEMFSWYGSRLLRAPGYFKELHRLMKINE